jgi:hypothetical protein
MLSAAISLRRHVMHRLMMSKPKENLIVDHGYVYAFEHRARGWIKIGMTEKNSPEHCWGRIEHYTRNHALPTDGWEMVSFIATPNARELENALHRSLNMFRVQIGGAKTELFQCGVPMLQSTLAGLRDFVEGAQSTMHGKPETDDQRIAREAQEIRREQARLRKTIDDEWIVKGELPSKDNRRERDWEFGNRWADHPIARRQRAEQAQADAARQAANQAERQAAADRHTAAERQAAAEAERRRRQEAARQAAEAERQAAADRHTATERQAAAEAERVRKSFAAPPPQRDAELAFARANAVEEAAKWGASPAAKWRVSPTSPTDLARLRAEREEAELARRVKAARGSVIPAVKLDKAERWRKAQGWVAGFLLLFVASLIGFANAPHGRPPQIAVIGFFVGFIGLAACGLYIRPAEPGGR